MSCWFSNIYSFSTASRFRDGLKDQIRYLPWINNLNDNILHWYLKNKLNCLLFFKKGDENGSTQSGGINAKTEASGIEFTKNKKGRSREEVKH